MREAGQIIRMDRNKGVVRLNPHGGCDKCGLNGRCHAAGSANRELTLPIRDMEVKPGELVEIETAPGGVITAALLVFILPLLLSVGAYALVSNGSKSEGPAVLAFLITFVAAELLIMALDQVFGRKSFFQPRIVRRLPPEKETNGYG